MSLLKSFFLFLISGLLCYTVANPVFVNITCRTMQTNNEIRRILTAKEIGFAGFDDNKFSTKSIKEQEEIIKLKIPCGQIVWQTDFDRYIQDNDFNRIKKELSYELDDIIDYCKQLNCKNIILVPGNKTVMLNHKEQFNRTVKILQWVSEYIKGSNITINLEAINRFESDSKFLTTQQDSLNLVKAINRPNIKILFDVYHAGMNNEDIMKELKACKDWIGYFHIADVPGRNEPGTGKLSYKDKIFPWIKKNLPNIPIGIECHQICNNQKLKETFSIFDK